MAEGILSSVQPTQDSLLDNLTDTNNFEKLPTDTRILDSPYELLSPVDAINEDATTFTFRLKKSILPRYIWLNEINISMKVSLEKKATTANAQFTPVDEADNVAPISDLLDGFWSKCDIYLNETKVTSDNPFRHISGHLGRSLTFNPSNQGTYLQTGLSYPDSGDPDRTWTKGPGINEGFKYRRTLFSKDSDNKAPHVHLLGVLSHCMGVDLAIQLTRNSNELLIMTGPDCKDAIEGKPAVSANEAQGIQAQAAVAKWTLPTDTKYYLRIHDIALLVRRPLISERLFTAHTRQLATKPCLYYYQHTYSQWLSIPMGINSYLSSPLSSTTSSLPMKMYMVFMDQTRLSGDYTKNTQKYCKPANLESVQMLLDSRPLGNFYNPTCATLSTGQDAFLYQNLWNVAQLQYDTGFSPNITFNDFKNHFFVLAFDLTSGGAISGDVLPLLRSGTLRLQLNFSTTTSEVTSILCFSLTNAVMQIDKNRHVNLSYRH